MNGFFVTGTDTDVGKTIASAVLLASLRARRDVLYWKPVQTGVETDSDTDTVRELADCGDEEIHEKGIRLEKPLSPHLSARLAGTRIGISDIKKDVPETKRLVVAEGAGGVLVPLNESEMMIDLISDLSLPAIVISRSGLGTINHTCLTLEALRQRSIDVAGVVMVGDYNVENKKAIEQYGGADVIAEIPLFDELESGSVLAFAKTLDLSGVLKKWRL